MTLAQKYRAEFAHHPSDRLLLYLAIAVILHLGAAVGSLAWWRSQPKVPEPEVTQPIEFVYIEAPSTTLPLDPDHPQAAINALGGGEQPASQSPNAGKPDELASKETTTPAIAPTPTRVPVRATTPTSATPKTLDAAPAPPEKSRSPLPTVAPLPTVTPKPDNIPPAAPTTPAPLPDLVAEPSPPAILPPAPTAWTSPSSLEPPVPTAGVEGQGLEGPVTPNTNAPATPPQVAAVQNVDLGPYQQAVAARLHAAWEQVPVTDPRRSVVRFTVNREGALLSLELKESSGLDTTDAAALQAVRTAAPFAPLPAAYPAEQLVINFAFVYEQREAP